MVFKSYDVRGTYPDQIDEDFSYRMGRAFVKFLGKKNIVAGYDARDSSKQMFDSLVRGLVDGGANVTKAGMITTPMLYWISAKKDFDGAITVTASHNPPNYTGFKLCGPNASSISLQKGLSDIKKRMEEEDFPKKEKGTEVEHDYHDEYCNHIVSFAKGDLSDLKIVIDVGNGTSGSIYENVLKKLNVNFKPMFFEPDGTFPNHPPNPLLPESQVAIKKELENNDYDLGILIDADGDRIIFLDEKGNNIKSSSIMLLLAEKYYNNANFAVDVLNFRTSVLKNMEGLGNIFPAKVGYVNVKDTSIENNCAMGVEYSGHYSHEETGHCDNSALALVKLLSCMSGKISQLVSKYEVPVIQVNFEVDDKDKKIEEIDKQYDGKTVNIDGVSKIYDNFWFNVRKSNTEPLLRVTIEASSLEKAEEVLEDIKVILDVSDGERYA